MQEKRSDIAKKVLEYWYTMEFLSQERFPRWSEDDKKSAVKAKKQEADRQYARWIGNEYKYPHDQVKVLKLLKRLDIEKDVYDQVKDEACKYGMTRWGTLTLYVGSIKREPCIQCIAEVLGETDEKRPEKTIDEVAWMSLQMDPTGAYIDDTVSLSPILWAIKALESKEENESIANYLSVQTYRKEIRDNFGDALADVTARGRVSEEKENEGTTRKKMKLDAQGVYIKKSEYPLLPEHLKKLTNRIQKDYIGEKFKIVEQPQFRIS